MNGQATSTGNRPHTEHQPCYYFHIGLIVTGKGEQAHLPKLFQSLVETGICTFEVFRFVGQRGPITSKKKKLEMIGSGKVIPDRDVSKIGLPARGYLNTDGCRFVLLVDDLEYDRQDQARQVFDRYRKIFDTILTAEQQRRASTHFLVNMLEAYYFADARAVNAILNLDPPLEDYPEDAEDIRHPKGELKRLYPGFDEVDDGGEILDRLNIEHILSRPDTCASLRTLFAWCSKMLEQHPHYESLSMSDKYRLCDGVLSIITGPQLSNI